MSIIKESINQYVYGENGAKYPTLKEAVKAESKGGSIFNEPGMAVQPAPSSSVFTAQPVTKAEVAKAEATKTEAPKVDTPQADANKELDWSEYFKQKNMNTSLKANLNNKNYQQGYNVMGNFDKDFAESSAKVAAFNEYIKKNNLTEKDINAKIIEAYQQKGTAAGGNFGGFGEMSGFGDLGGFTNFNIENLPKYNTQTTQTQGGTQVVSTTATAQEAQKTEVEEERKETATPEKVVAEVETAQKPAQKATLKTTPKQELLQPQNQAVAEILSKTGFSKKGRESLQNELVKYAGRINIDDKNYIKKIENYANEIIKRERALNEADITGDTRKTLTNEIKNHFAITTNKGKINTNYKTEVENYITDYQIAERQKKGEKILDRQTQGIINAHFEYKKQCQKDLTTMLLKVDRSKLSKDEYRKVFNEMIREMKNLSCYDKQHYPQELAKSDKKFSKYYAVK